MYYREAMVYTPFAATGLGLGAIAIISVLDGRKWRKERKEEKIAAASNVGNIQTSMHVIVHYTFRGFFYMKQREYSLII